MISAVFSIIKETFEKSKKSKLKMVVIEEAVKSRGFTKDNLKKCIDQYIGLNVFAVGDGTNELILDQKK